MDDKIYSILLDIKSDLGELKSGQAANHEHIIAVNVNQKQTAKELADHKENPKAHGIALILGLGGICAPFAWELLKKVLK